MSLRSEKFYISFIFHEAKRKRLTLLFIFCSPPPFSNCILEWIERLVTLEIDYRIQQNSC